MKCPHCNSEIPCHRNPVPTVDIIIEIDDRIVLIERKNPPYGWALPGGFVDYGESYEAAALREAFEETGLEVAELRQFRTYSEPDRDPRQHNASTVFIGKACGSPNAGDDAARAGLFGRDNLPQLAFDHAKILADYYSAKNIETKGRSAAASN
jgi:ADP-ribose pyrophosphatase YjhB (NUDIX family)